MNLSAPKQVTWLVSVVLIVVGVIAQFVDLAAITDYNFWIVTIGAVILAVASYVKGL